MDSRAAYGHMLWGAFAFAAMVAMSHLAGERCDWQYVAFARSFVAFLLAVGVARATGVPLVFRGPAPLWVRSVAGSLGVATSFYAYTHLPVSDAVTLNTTSSIWVTVIGWALFGQPATARTWIAVATGVLGVVIIQRPHFASGQVAASAMGLLSAVCAATSMLGLNRLKSVDPRAVVAHFSGAASVVTLGVLLSSDSTSRADRAADPVVLLLLLGVGAAGVVGQYGMTLAFANGNASRVSVVGLTQILWSLGLDVAIWGFRVDGLSLLGMGLVAAPTAWLLLHRQGPSDEVTLEHSLQPL